MFLLLIFFIPVLMLSHLFTQGREDVKMTPTALDSRLGVETVNIHHEVFSIPFGYFRLIYF